MRKSELIFDAITNIREELVEQALDYRFVRRASQWRRYLSAAACIALVVMVGFGALRLGIFGGFGGSSKNDAACNTAAPESSGWNDTVSDDCAVENTTDSPAEEPGDAPQYSTDDAGELMTFTALVLEVHENFLLVEPVEGEWILSSADRIQVPVEEAARFREGDSVIITFTGDIQETYPARITDVVSITAAEEKN